MAPNINDLNNKINTIKNLVIHDLNATTKELIKYTNNSNLSYPDSGKKLRPLLLILAAKSISNTVNRNNSTIYKKNYIALAAAIELIHNASLLHDDVLDNSLERRGKKTVNAEFNNKLAILIGDLLYSKSFKLINKINCKNLTKVIDNVAHTCDLMVQGEILELYQKYNVTISKKQYLNIITGKTAKLFMTAMQLPAILNYDDAREKLLGDCGLNFGIAYQLLDDIEDYYNKGNDLLEGKITLPILSVINNNRVPGSIKEKIFSIITTQVKCNIKRQKSQLAMLTKIILNHGGFASAAKLAKKYLTKAKAAINTLPESIYKKGILNIVNSYEYYASEVPAIIKKNTYLG